jgi:hypothetical protein
LKPAEPLIVNEKLLKAKTVTVTPGAGVGSVMSEVDINDVPQARRNLLTLGITQEDILRSTGASVTTKGRYMTDEEREKSSAGDRALYLLVTGPTQDAVDKAVARIRGVMSGEKTGAKTAKNKAAAARAAAAAARMAPQPLMSLNPNPTGMAYVQEKLFIGLEHAPPSFDVKHRVVGPSGCYLLHIQMETGAKVMLRGKGSDFMEPTSGREAFEPMYIYVQHSTVHGLQQAKQLALNLIDTVHQDYSVFQESLAALPPTVSAGTASMLAGYQQGAVFNPYSAYSAPGLPANNGTMPWTANTLPIAPYLPLPGSLPSFVPPVSVPAVQSSLPTFIPNPLASLPSLPLPVSSSLTPSASSHTPSTTSHAHSTSSYTPGGTGAVDTSKRRFTEEKEAETPDTDDLLGYQHGPLHLVSTQTTLPTAPVLTVPGPTTVAANTSAAAPAAGSDEIYDPFSADDDDLSTTSHNSGLEPASSSRGAEQLMPPPTPPVLHAATMSASCRSATDDMFIAPLPKLLPGNT